MPEDFFEAEISKENFLVASLSALLQVKYFTTPPPDALRFFVFGANSELRPSPLYSDICVEFRTEIDIKSRHWPLKVS